MKKLYNWTLEDQNKMSAGCFGLNAVMAGVPHYPPLAQTAFKWPFLFPDAKGYTNPEIAFQSYEAYVKNAKDNKVYMYMAIQTNGDVKLLDDTGKVALKGIPLAAEGDFNVATYNYKMKYWEHMDQGAERLDQCKVIHSEALPKFKTTIFVIVPIPTKYLTEEYLKKMIEMGWFPVKKPTK